MTKRPTHADGTPLTTEERGLGHEHRQARKRALAELVEGTPCHYCNRPMYSTQKLHLDHYVPRALGGGVDTTVLTHAVCNMRAGNKLGKALHRGRIRRVRRSRW